MRSGCRTSRSICARSSGTPSSSRSSGDTPRGETPNPCTRCNGSFRFDELLAFAAQGRGRASSATGHYARIVEQRRPAAAGARGRSGQGPVVHARAGSTRGSSSGSSSRSASGPRRRRAREAAAAGLAGRGAAREPGGVLPRRRRLPHVPRAPRPRPPRRARSSTRRARSSAGTTAYWRFTPGQRRGIGVAAAEPLYALRTDAESTPSSSARAARSLARVVGVTRRPACSGRPRRREAPVPLASDPRSCRAAARWLRARARRAVLRRRARADRRSLRRSRRRRRLRRGVGRAASLGSRRAAPCRQRRRSRELIALAVFLVAVGAALAYVFVRLGGTFARLSSFIKGTETELLPVIHKVGGASTG